MVRRTLRSARTVSGLVSAMTNTANAIQLHRLSADRIADAAVDALLAEALLTPKPGLVDASDDSVSRASFLSCRLSYGSSNQWRINLPPALTREWIERL